jgi:acetolactate synthase I/II/III large subunit
VNGAESLIHALVDAGVDCCFANPGTSEMHLVQAIDAVPRMRAVLALFEGVCSGAADGYGRMRGMPALTLLHLGAGLGNAVANLHNARRAGTPLINIVGDHAIHHVPYDAPLTSDIEGVARPVSAWIRTARTAAGLAHDGRDAVRAALRVNPNPLGNIATLIVPADCAWGDGHAEQTGRIDPLPRARVPHEVVTGVATALDADSMLLLDGEGLSEPALHAAARVATASGCRLYSSTFPARVESGPGLPSVTRMPYFPEQVRDAMAGVRRLVLAGAEPPVSFFAYRGQASDLVPEGCSVVRLAHRHEDVAAALADLADAVDAPRQGNVVVAQRGELPTGALSAAHVARILAALAPEPCIVATDSGGGGAAYPLMQRAVRHSWLNLTGGAIGQGGPAATGAALACPDRQVFALLGDGGAMYTIQCLWTQAREHARVVTVIYSNRSYNILEVEYRRLGINDIGATAASLFDLSAPVIDWVGLAASMGVPGARASTCEDFAAALQRGIESDGPFLIQADV